MERDTMDEGTELVLLRNLEECRRNVSEIQVEKKDVMAGHNEAVRSADEAVEAVLEAIHTAKHSEGNSQNELVKLRRRLEEAIRDHHQALREKWDQASAYNSDLKMLAEQEEKLLKALVEFRAGELNVLPMFGESEASGG